MSSSQFSRRRLFEALGIAGAASATSRLLPFLPQAALAADSAAPKRLLCVFHPMGWLENDFFPTVNGADFTLGPAVTALNDWKQKLIFMDGLMLYGAEWFFPDDDNEHGSGMAMAFTGSKKQNYSTGPSIDGAVADALLSQGIKTPFKSIGLGVNAPGPSGHTSCFFSAAQQPVNAQNNPKAAFDSFLKGVQGGGAPMIDTAALARKQAQKKSVIDLVKGDLDRVCKKVGAAEKEKCDAHLAGLRDIEARLAKDQTAPTGVVGCTTPAAPAGGDLAANVHAQMDNLTAALACDLTRVVTLQLGFCDGGLEQIPGINHHDTTHAVGDRKGDPGPIADHRKIDKWHADRFAYLLRKLDAVKEQNGTLLDNTLVLFGSDTTTGQSKEVGAHQHWRFPFFMAGGGNFAFKTGRALTYAMPAMGDMNKSKQWAVHNRLLTSIARAFGMNVDKFGTLDPGTGPLPQL